MGYNTETQFSVVQEMPFLDLSVIRYARCQRVKTIGIVNYKSRIFLLGVIAGFHLPPLWSHFSAVALWEANPSAGEWKVLTTTPLELLSKYGINFSTCELVPAYDGERTVTIIARSGWIRTMLLELNLDTKEWNMLCNHRNIPAEISNSFEGLKAFHFKLKICTAM